jgi:hypothetical protein
VGVVASLRLGTPFIGGERDGAEVGPHIGDDDLVGRMRARSVFKHRSGPLFHRARLKSLKQTFVLIFQTAASLQNHNALFCCSEIFKTLHECSVTHCELRSFWKQVQIQN